MARQIDTEITETIDDIIFYKRNGKFLMRTVQKQAKASQEAANNYGRASNKAKVLRQLLQPLLPNAKDRNMQNRLTPAMRAYLALVATRIEIQPIKNPLAGFRFALTSDLKDCLLFSLGFSQEPNGDILVQIPSINPTRSIVAPAGTSRVQLEVVRVGFSMNDDQAYSSPPEIISIPYVDQMQPAVNQILEVNAPTTNIIVVALTLRYWNHDRQISQGGFMPVEIMAVFKS